MKYLYGASVQGIQKFIFNSSKLREIIGASEMVEKICTEKFGEQLAMSREQLKKGPGSLLNAAGHIRYLFPDKESCQKLVYDFPRKMMDFAPGITISQAVVEVNDQIQPDHIKRLNERIAAQRSTAQITHGLGWMISERSRKTGRPGVEFNKNVLVDAAQLKKEEVFLQSSGSLLQKFTGAQDITSLNARSPKEMNDLTEGREDNWIAVIHADGNNLGQTIQQLATETAKENVQKVQKRFSLLLEQCTLDAAKSAFRDVVEPAVGEKQGMLPVRPVILGGDDITLIIRGDLAVDFTKSYLEHFSRITRQVFDSFSEEYNLKMLKGGFTACAGIAFIKQNYPFHYGADLAEELCSYSKKTVKSTFGDTPPAAFHFHKVRDSFIDSYKDEIIKRELTAGEISLNYGPYLVGPESDLLPSADTLIKMARALQREAAPKMALRNWISDLYSNPEAARQKMDRIMQIHPGYIKKLGLGSAISKKKIKGQEREFEQTHIFDILSLASIIK
ncbi:MAG: hypothetical protein P1P82_16975 [Bacteroidales bacterium]|nr:hypothetical protein [Bacteroidales bacterium]